MSEEAVAVLPDPLVTERWWYAGRRRVSGHDRVEWVSEDGRIHSFDPKGGWARDFIVGHLYTVKTRDGGTSLITSGPNAPRFAATTAGLHEQAPVWEARDRATFLEGRARKAAGALRELLEPLRDEYRRLPPPQRGPYLAAIISAVIGS